MAKRDNSFSLKILAENAVVYDDRCEQLFLPSMPNSMTDHFVILSEHTPMIAKLGVGEVVVKRGKESRVIATIQTGLIYVGNNEATVLLDL